MKRLQIFIVLGLAALLITSCSKDFITQNPADAINQDEAITDATSMQAALNGVYAAFRSYTLYGRDFPVIGDVQADNAYVETKNAGRYLPQYQYTVTSSDAVATEVWQGDLTASQDPGAYTAIMRANRVIDADIAGDDIAGIKAQAYALRALMYFKLVNLYARPYTDDSSALGVPLVLHYNPYDLPARSTVGQVYNQIISDYQAAFASGPDYTSSVYLSKYAIEGLLAKAYLYMGDYQHARDAAADVINNGPFSLVTYSNYGAYWSSPASRTDAVETLLEIDADVINNNGFDDLGGIYINGYQDIYASGQLYSLYGTGDVRKTVLIEGETKNGKAAILVNKYPNAQNGDRDNLKVMRLSEVYLIAAEADARLANYVEASMYLNDLMAQRDPSLTYTSTGAQLISDIVTERRKELAFEGDRLFDLNRLMLPVEREENAGALPAPLSIPYSDYRRIYPIPLEELQANPSLATQQNPGY
jgi:tetratricopeptide (TPR) repeat protein